MPRIIETIVEYEIQTPCKTAEEMEQVCCEVTNPLQCCELSEGVWRGYTAQELLAEYHPGLDDLGRDSSGRYVSVRLQPREVPCGEKLIEYDVSTGNCCDEVSEITVDEDSTPEILPSGEGIVFYSSGGRPPYTFKTSANETHFANGKKEIITNLSYVGLSATDDFCGATSVSVEDGCSSDSIEIISDQGEWRVFSTTCESGIAGFLAGGDYTGTSLTRLYGGNISSIKGRYKVVENVRTEEHQGFSTQVYCPGAWSECTCADQVCDLSTDPLMGTKSTCMELPDSMFQCVAVPGYTNKGCWQCGPSAVGCNDYSGYPYDYSRYATTTITFYRWECE